VQAFAGQAGMTAPVFCGPSAKRLAGRLSRRVSRLALQTGSTEPLEQINQQQEAGPSRPPYRSSLPSARDRPCMPGAAFRRSRLKQPIVATARWAAFTMQVGTGKLNAGLIGGKFSTCPEQAWHVPALRLGEESAIA
jgi:hypothetical protein